MADWEGDIEALAELWRIVRYESRRRAKRYLHDTGLPHCTAGQLDAVLAMIRERPDADEIVGLAEAMQAAKMRAARERTADRESRDSDLPEWLIGEVPQWGRTFVIHFCPGRAWSFAGEVFDEGGDGPADLESYPLDGAQVIANITWLEGRPGEKDLADLMQEARRQLRMYDQGA